MDRGRLQRTPRGRPCRALHDGRLILVPEPTYEHQYAARVLANDLSEAIGDPHLVVGPVDVRMADGHRYRSPDLVVLRSRYRGRPADPQNVQLVAEIVSPGGGDEYDQKMIVYAEAGIAWYLIVQETPAGYFAELYELETTSNKYVRHSATAPAGELDLPEPFHGTLRLRQLS
ncbi:Uma2 family endonuclease [Fodinicola feengrottensis]|uniref:Uma2 family endonuclease n=1 Tax=Fodinicola feengrottensis TaxID=435914 RepID=UPI002441E16F|nr:Uma2 family endonuclease [Fodinicola feengrottensis]